MKQFYFLFLLGITLQAQNPQTEFTNDRWFLREIVFDDYVDLAPDNSDVYIFYQSSFTFHFGDDPYTVFDISGCNEYSVKFNELTDSTFNLLQFNYTENNCEYQEYQDFEISYYEVFADLNNQTFQYEVEQNSDGSKTLSITNPDGIKAIYSDQSTFELENHTWYLTEIINDGISNPVPVDSNVSIDYNTSVMIEYSELFNTLYTLFMTSGCNSIGVEFGDLTDTNFNLMTVSTTLLECQHPEFDAFDGLYFNHFNSFENQNFTYEIVNEGNLTKLIITNPIGNEAIYVADSNLLTNDISETKIRFYPNPVHDKLTIENPDLKINQIKITDANGKLILQQNLNSYKTEIDFSKYPNGVYFLSTESNGKIKTEKVIKK